MESTDILKQILEYVQRGNPGLDKLAPAYVRAWAEIGAVVVKNANNPHFDNDYADLKAVLEVVKPVFGEHNLALLTVPGKIREGNQSVHWVLLHSSGQLLQGEAELPMGAKQTAQSSGSCTTYGRRYITAAIGGLAQADDDGEAASAPPPKKKAEKSDTKTGNGETYADAKAALVAEIEAFAGSVDDLEKTLRPRVEQLGDDDINRAYVMKKRALKGKK